MAMTRAEHLEWAKNRALEYVDVGDTINAVMPMISDLGKHEDVQAFKGFSFATTILLLGGQLSSPEQVRRYIEGFN